VKRFGPVSGAVRFPARTICFQRRNKGLATHQRLTAGVEGETRKPKPDVVACSRKLLHRFGPPVKYTSRGPQAASPSVFTLIADPTERPQPAHAARCRPARSGACNIRAGAPAPHSACGILFFLFWLVLAKIHIRGLQTAFPGGSARTPETSGAAGSFGVPSRRTPSSAGGLSSHGHPTSPVGPHGGTGSPGTGLPPPLPSVPQSGAGRVTGVLPPPPALRRSAGLCSVSAQPCPFL